MPGRTLHVSSVAKQLEYDLRDLRMALDQMKASTEWVVEGVIKLSGDYSEYLTKEDLTDLFAITQDIDNDPEDTDFEDLQRIVHFLVEVDSGEEARRKLP